MGRKTSTYISCDGPGCKMIVEASGEAEDGWCRVNTASEGKYSPHPWEFHSLRCMERWARERRHALSGRPGAPRSSRPRLDLADDETAQILEAFEAAGSDAISTTDIVELTGLERSGVQRRVNALREQEKITCVQERRGPFAARYRLADDSQG